MAKAKTKAKTTPKRTPKPSKTRTLSGDGFIADVALSALEALWIALPPGAEEIRVGFAPDPRDGLLRVKSTTATTTRTASGELDGLRARCDPSAWLAVATAAFRRLQEELMAERIRWNGATAMCRMLESAHPAVVAGAADIPIGDALLANTIFTPALAAALDLELPTAARRQDALVAEWKDLEGWSHSASTCELELALPSGGRRVPATVIGSWSGRESTFLWSWANSSLAPAACGETPSLRLDPAIGVFRRPGFFCDEGFASMVATLAGSRTHARAVFPARSRSLVTFLALA